MTAKPKTELIERRTEKSKTFSLGGNKYALKASIGALHYKDDYTDPGKQWKDIDLTWEGNRITKAPYELTLEGNKITIRDKKTGEVSTIELLSGKPAGLKWEIIPRNDKISFRHTLPSDKVPFEAQFKITGAPLISEVTDTTPHLQGKAPYFNARASDNEGELELETSFVDGILTEKLSQVKDKRTGQIRPAKGNIRIDPTFSVGASSDDCVMWWSAGWYFEVLTAPYLLAGYYNSDNYKYGSGLRFTGVTIPKPATIDTAYLTLVCRGAISGTVVRTRITGEDVDNAATWSSEGNYKNRRGTVVGGANDNYITDAQVDWDAIPAWTEGTSYNSPSIVSIIQEIVNRAGWASGNALALWWDDYDDRSSHVNYARRDAASWDDEEYDPPALYIEYSPTTHATLHGSIIDTGGENADFRGFVWDTVSRGDPGNVAPGDSAYASHWTEGNSYGVDSFEHQVTGLAGGDTFYFRACAHNSAGWSYGGEKSFETPAGIAYEKTLTESLGLVDTYSRTWAAHKTYSELLGLADVVSKAVVQHPLIESLGLSDTVVKEPGKVLKESLGLEDRVSKHSSKALVEVLGLLDSISYGKNLTVLAKLIRKYLQLVDIGGGGEQ